MLKKIFIGLFIPALALAQPRLDTTSSSLSASNARVTQVIFADGTTQTTAGVSGNTTVTNLPDTLVYRNISNAWSAAQTLPAGSTILGATFGLDYWLSTNGTATQAGIFLYPTQNISAASVGLFIGTNESVSLTRPDGTASGGIAIGQRAISLVPFRISNTEVALGSSSVAIGSRARVGNQAGVAIGFASHAVGSGIFPSVSLGQNATATGIGAFTAGYSLSSNGDGAVAIGNQSSANGGNSSIAMGDQSAANTTGNGIAVGRGNVSSAGGAIAFGGRRAKAAQVGSAVITGDTGDYDKNSQGTNTITFSFREGAYFTETNAIYASITRTGGINNTVGYGVGANIGITVTQTFLDASSNIRTNIYIGGILVTGYTE